MKTRNLLLSAVVFTTLAVVPSPVHAEFRPLTPCRVLDTRLPGEGPALLGGAVRAINVRGLCGIPPSATAITYNATIVSGSAPGFLTLYPGDETVPRASSLNFFAGDVRNNAGVVRLADSQAELGSYLATSPSGQTAHLILDVTGYHAGSIVTLAARMLGEDYTANRWITHSDGTATDRMTGLQWELKTDDGGVHDKDGTTSWDFARLSFPAALNTEPCFAGHCDWRLPTIDELQSISEPGYPSCTTPPCTKIPHHTESARYWASTSTTGSSYAWTVNFADAFLETKSKTENHHVRAVRDGSK